MKTKTYKEIVLYVFWGVVTTITNLAVYSLCRINSFFSIQCSTIIAWFISVFAAFVSNKFFVFTSKNKKVPVFMRELCLFYGSRILSGVIDIVLMAIMTRFDFLHEKLAKLLVNIFIICINYIFSKVIIFRTKSGTP
jgi:putative flippase GtrA